MPKSTTSTASLLARITALRKRHAELDTRIDRELSRPAPDSAMLVRLKKHKLMIKDEMARYEGVLRSVGQRIADVARGNHSPGETA